MNRRWIRPVALGVVVFFLLATLLLAPAQAGRTVKSAYHHLPTGLKRIVPDAWERGMGGFVDGVTRWFALGNPDLLIKFDLRLTNSSQAPGSWGPDRNLTLAWTDLGSDKITYEVRYGHDARSGTADVLQGRAVGPGAIVKLPTDGTWYVRVRPFNGASGGHTTTFGPFRIDSSPAPAPVLEPIPPPPAYDFLLHWSPVSDDSGIAGYQVERVAQGTVFQRVGTAPGTSHLEEQVGNGHYSYRVRAINGAGVLGLPSNVEEVTVQAPMQNPGAGTFRYGVQANYTSFLRLWDLSDTSQYARIGEVPADLADAYLGPAWGIETQNQTLQQATRQVVGSENNTMEVAEKLFVWLFDWADYDREKLNASSAGGDGGGLQSAGQTYDRHKGICGDLATLYITMLRIAKVPARPVHGYLDNPSAGIGDFHLWVEVWVGPSLRSADPNDTSLDWMTVDVSGITGPYKPELLMLYFALFNPEYLALGREADYTQPSWNTWARFNWTLPRGSDAEFHADAHPVELGYELKDLYFNPSTKARVLVDPGADPPSRGYTKYFKDVKAVSKKRIDYGADVEANQGPPVSATIRIRHPQADAYGRTLPWQSVIYQVYQSPEAARTVNPDPATHKPYSLAPYGFVLWQDDFR